MMMKRKITFSFFLSLVSIITGIAIGSVFIPPADISAIFLNKLFSVPLPEGFSALFSGMIWNIRLPRVIMAFLVGGALAVSGTVMQSILQNPLASAYGLGISSGAGLGVALLMVSGLAGGMYGFVLMPVTGLCSGLAAVFLAISIAQKVDKNLSNRSIVLTGMVLSLFINALLSTVAAMFPSYAPKINLWQLGSFSMKEWKIIGIFAVVLLFCLLVFLRFHREMDIMTFGQEQALSVGVELKKIKWILIIVTAFLTGTAVAFVGIIGFIDLVAPHIVRKFFGSSHKIVLPMSVLFGGSFMVLCDIIARTVASPSEVPIGSVTALIGAPFFVYVYLKMRKA